MHLKTKKNLLIVLFIIIVLIGGLSVTLFSYQKVYAGKIYKNIYFSEINLSGKTKIQAKYLLDNEIRSVLNRRVTISANDKSVSATLADTGLSFDSDSVIKQSYKIGRSGSFVNQLKTSMLTLFRKNNLAATPAISQEKYKQFVDIAVAQLNVTPQDAALTVQNGQVVLQNSASGVTVSTEQLKDSLINLAGTNSSVISLAASTTPPNVSDADFSQAQQQATDLLAKKYSFTYSGRSYSPTAVQIDTWIEFVTSDGQTTAQLNSNNVKAYLNIIAKNFEVGMLQRKVNATTNEVIDAGREGVSLDKDAAVASLNSQLSQGIVAVALTTTTTPAKEVRIVPNEGLVLGRFDGKYIDVNLATQKLCRIEGTNLVECTTVSTGKASMPTPTGTYSILNKSPRRWSSSAGLWMPWWEEFKAGGWGLHELPEWPNGYKEGADHLGIPVSHGCIRLGIGPAEALYNWTEIGTQIYIHK
ncbi:hypothetical protein COT78_04025 [Candidatus Berkelbacteria bacterium CG10_big_fil_rev_8_21_14_0_10_43_13]|uniref:L,D-TPase catalytic domain-containing protein n=1 Tax=Candidatus Berkelbacteria bacterium CG10_big_fil_rev_8_21_14_0_10_43_13 TaxID=1974514 RepID=A0A2H0W5L3_9BACT|nr:MAG: hypothetical protein COT78_04025 [Candidatus Berkelbacteria bacterium CG10_big_fil_rev_8_21_14_0_10_43_13]